MDARLLELLGEGSSYAEAAAELRVGREAVRHRASVLRRPRRRFEWTDEVEGRAVQMRRAGATLADIAQVLGCSESCVCNNLRGLAFAMPARRRVELTSEEADRAMAMYAAGASITDIASALGHDSRLVSPVIQRAVDLGELEPHPQRRRWGSAEDATLRAMARRGAGIADVARATGFCESAVVKHARMLGVRFRSRGPEEQDVPAGGGLQDRGTLDAAQRRAALLEARRLWGLGVTDLATMAKACAAMAGVTPACMRRELPRLLEAEARAMRRHHLI